MRSVVVVAVALAGAWSWIARPALGVPAAQTMPEPTPYTLRVTFQGLVAFVPVNPSASTLTSTEPVKVDELWALLPGVSRHPDADVEKHMKHPKAFRPKSKRHPDHHAAIGVPATHLLPAADAPPELGTWLPLDPDVGYDLTLVTPGRSTARSPVTLTGFQDVPAVRDGNDVARACAGCTSETSQPSLPEDVTMAARMVFRAGEEVAVDVDHIHAWSYSEAHHANTFGPPAKDVPVSVTVKVEGLTEPATLVIRRRGDTQGASLRLSPGTGPEPEVHIAVVNVTARELLGEKRRSDNSDPPFQHFKLLYLLAPGPGTLSQARAHEYGYSAYIYPRRHTRPKPSASMHVLRMMPDRTGGDPFCTTPGQMKPR